MLNKIKYFILYNLFYIIMIVSSILALIIEVIGMIKHNDFSIVGIILPSILIGCTSYIFYYKLIKENEK